MVARKVVESNNTLSIQIEDLFLTLCLVKLAYFRSISLTIYMIFSWYLKFRYMGQKWQRINYG